jgi:hypothetical protein
VALCGYVFTLARYEFQTVTLPKASLPRDFQLLLAKCLTVNKKLYPYAIIALLALVLLFVKRCKSGRTSKPDVTNHTRKDPASDVNRNRGFDRRVSYIEYTEHAKCRMQCRHISQQEVEEIMQDGKINYNKTDVNARPCPSYALEGITKDNQRVRIVFGQCDLKTKVITVIDRILNGVVIAVGMTVNTKEKNSR